MSPYYHTSKKQRYINMKSLNFSYGFLVLGYWNFNPWRYRKFLNCIPPSPNPTKKKYIVVHTSASLWFCLLFLIPEQTRNSSFHIEATMLSFIYHFGCSFFLWFFILDMIVFRGFFSFLWTEDDLAVLTDNTTLPRFRTVPSPIPQLKDLRDNRTIR